MNYKKIFTTLRYTCLLAVIVLGLVTIIGTGGSSDNGSSNGSINGNGQDDASLEPPDELTSEELAGLVNDEEADQVMAAKFNGDDLQLQFDNGATFSLPANANYNSGIGEVVISLLSGERFFNTDGDIVFDLSQTEHDYNIDFELVLPSGLEADDIAVFLYSPGSSQEEVDLVLVKFDYDQASGKLSSNFTAPTAEAHATILAHSPHSQAMHTAPNSNRKYTRLVLSWSSRRELADGPVGNIIPMPFYEQNDGTCWAAGTKMMARAYAPVNDRSREFRLHDIVRYMNHSDFSRGVGRWAFTRYIPAYLRSRTGVEFEGSTFLRTKKLESEIIRLIDDGRPVMLNLNYPDYMQHQIVVIGYERKLVSTGRATFRLLYHNPQNISSSSYSDMYRWSDFDWLMKDKSPVETVQIVYAKQPPPAGRALLTLATPILDKPLMHHGQSLGELKIHYPRETGSGVIDMVYDLSQPRGYSWVKRLGSEVVEMIPADATHISLTQHVFNAAQTTASGILRVEAFAMSGGRILDETHNLNLPQGTSSHGIEIDLTDFAAEEDDEGHEIREIMVLIYMEGGSRFLDGYEFRFVMAPDIDCGWDVDEVNDFNYGEVTRVNDSYVELDEVASGYAYVNSHGQRHGPGVGYDSKGRKILRACFFEDELHGYLRGWGEYEYKEEFKFAQTVHARYNHGQPHGLIMRIVLQKLFDESEGFFVTCESTQYQNGIEVDTDKNFGECQWP